MTNVVKFKKLHPEAKLPYQATQGSLGLDLYAHLLDERGRPNKAIVPPNCVRAIATGLAIEPPPRDQSFGVGDRSGNQWLVQVVSRSGLVKDYCLLVANAPGIIDPDYRGELKVLLYNGGHTSQYVENGMRIAQIILVRAEYMTPCEVKELSISERGDNGFGSTGR